MRHFHFARTDSTNVQARQLAEQHPGERLLVTASEQTAGRGRRGRTWHSPPGGAWLTLVWPLRRAAASYAAAPLAAAVALRRAVCDAAPEAAARLRIKWPNDLLLDDRKIAGILCERCAATSTSNGDGGQRNLLIVGVGVNADFDAQLLPTQLRHPATTLRTALGRPVSVDGLIEAVARELVAALTALEIEGVTARRRRGAAGAPGPCGRRAHVGGAGRADHRPRDRHRRFGPAAAGNG